MIWLRTSCPQSIQWQYDLPFFVQESFPLCKCPELPVGLSSDILDVDRFLSCRMKIVFGYVMTTLSLVFLSSRKKSPTKAFIKLLIQPLEWNNVSSYRSSSIGISNVPSVGSERSLSCSFKAKETKEASCCWCCCRRRRLHHSYSPDVRLRLTMVMLNYRSECSHHQGLARIRIRFP